MAVDSCALRPKLRRTRRAPRRAAVATVLVCLMLPAAAHASASVSVYPVPGSHVALPHAQITLRGLPAAQIGNVTVTGSASGLHPGTIAADSDGMGASFIPTQAFQPGETVTVATSLNVAGAKGGTYQFRVASPAGGFLPVHWPAAARKGGDVAQFQSRPDLRPVNVQVTRLAHGTDPEFIFVAPQFGPLQDGPMILDAHGRLVWFKPLTGDTSASDFKVQTYQGQPVLTWWQGYVVAGVGVGQDEIYNSSYQQVAVVKAGNGVSADLHEFRITPRGTALITATEPVYWDASSVHASKREIVTDSIVQEIDIQTGLVLFQWDSLDHVPLTDSYSPPPRSVKSPYDYFHANAIDLDRDGNLLISARNTWAVYKVDHRTGRTIWTLGGRRSSFKLAPGTYWAFQHDARVRANNDQYVTLFDNDAGPPAVHKQSRAIKLLLDVKHMRARLVSARVHSPSLVANNEGDYQQLSDHHDFVGWGQQPYLDEFDSAGHVLFDARFADQNSNYRAYKLAWSGTPDAALYPPAVAASKRGSGTVVYASWNGATHVHNWRVLGGSSPTALAPVGSATKVGFETTISVPKEAYVAVQAIDWSGNVMASSGVVAPR